jgi:hypothetical protein
MHGRGYRGRTPDTYVGRVTPESLREMMRRGRTRVKGNPDVAALLAELTDADRAAYLDGEELPDSPLARRLELAVQRALGLKK